MAECKNCGIYIRHWQTVHYFGDELYCEECFDELHRETEFDDEPDYMEIGHAELEDMLLEKENDR